MVWASGQSRQLPSGHVFGLRLRRRATPWWTSGFFFLPKEWTKDKARLDKASVPKASQAYRTRHQLALELLAKNGTRLPHGWISGDDQWGDRIGFGVDLPPWVSATCWRSRRTRPCVIWKPSPLSIALRVVGPGLPGKALRPGVNRLVKEAWHRIDVRDGSKGPWWLRPSKDVCCREPIGVSQAMRRCWWSSATVTATSKRW